MQDAAAIGRICRKFQSLEFVLDERSRRQWAAAEAKELGYGGVSAVARATGFARDTMQLGLRELEYRRLHPEEPTSERLRKPGGGRKQLVATDPALVSALVAVVEALKRCR